MSLAHSQSPVGRQRFARTKRKKNHYSKNKRTLVHYFFYVQHPMDTVKQIFAINNLVK